MNDIQKFLEQTTKVDTLEYGDYQVQRPWIVCNDGEGVSIQDNCPSTGEGDSF